MAMTANTAAGTLKLTSTGTGGSGYVRNTNGLLNVVSATGFNPSFTTAPTAAGGSSVSGAGSNAILIGATEQQYFVPPAPALSPPQPIPPMARHSDGRREH